MSWADLVFSLTQDKISGFPLYIKKQEICSFDTVLLSPKNFKMAKGIIINILDISNLLNPQVTGYNQGQRLGRLPGAAASGFRGQALSNSESVPKGLCVLIYQRKEANSEL